MHAELDAVVELRARVDAFVVPVEFVARGQVLEGESEAARGVDADGFGGVEDAAVEEGLVEGGGVLSGHFEAAGEEEGFTVGLASGDGEGDRVAGMAEEDAGEGLEVDPEVGSSDVGEEPDVDWDEAGVDFLGEVGGGEVVVECGLD